MISAQQALIQHAEGNQRYLAGTPKAAEDTRSPHRSSLALGQQPWAIVLGCSDSRVPPEIVLDQGPGDLFVIRVAGNVVTPTQLGSIEFAAENFGSPLIVVLGHTGCGAVNAVLDLLENSTEIPSMNLRSIADEIKPALEPLHDSDLRNDRDTLARASVRENVNHSVKRMQDHSETLSRLARTAGLKIVGAEYSLATGIVDFLDEPNTDG